MACSAVADWLEENGAAEAADVRRLACAVPVIPLGAPRWLTGQRHGGGWAGVVADPLTSEPPEGLSASALPECFPMASGPWWSIDLRPDGVVGRFYHGEPIADRSWSDRTEPGVRGHWPFGVNFPPASRGEALLRRGFDVARRQLIGLALGEDFRYDE